MHITIVDERRSMHDRVRSNHIDRKKPFTCAPLPPPLLLPPVCRPGGVGGSEAAALGPLAAVGAALAAGLTLISAAGCEDARCVAAAAGNMPLSRPLPAPPPPPPGGSSDAARSSGLAWARKDAVEASSSLLGAALL